MRLEYLYVLYSFDFPLRGKVGVSNNVAERRADIQASLRAELNRNVTVRTLWKMPVITSAYDIEAAIHRAIHPLRCDSIPGSGRTEWFWSPNIVTALCGGLLFWGFGVTEPTLRALFLLFVPVPLDLAISVTLLALVEYSVLVAIAIFGWRLISTLLQIALI